MRHRFVVLAALVVVAMTATASALAFDCIRVSSSLQGLRQSTTSGNWLLFDFNSAAGVQDTFANVFDTTLDTETAACLAAHYAESGQPLYFALGIGVAGGKKESVTSNGARAAADGFGVIAWNANEVVLGDGSGIDHLEDSGIFAAGAAAAEACGVTLPGE